LFVQRDVVRAIGAKFWALGRPGNNSHSHCTIVACQGQSSSSHRIGREKPAKTEQKRKKPLKKSESAHQAKINHRDTNVVLCIGSAHFA